MKINAGKRWLRTRESERESNRSNFFFVLGGMQHTNVKISSQVSVTPLDFDDNKSCWFKNKVTRYAVAEKVQIFSYFITVY